MKSPLKAPDARLFLAAQGALYLWFLRWDLLNMGDTRWIKYASIVLCFLFAAYQAARGGDRLTAAALAFTLGADAFLLLLDRYYPWASACSASHTCFTGGGSAGRGAERAPAF